MSATTSVRASACPLDCPDLCSLSVTVSDGRVTEIAGSRVNPTTEELICGKVREYARHVYHPERLLHPLVRESGAGPKSRRPLRPATWDEALGLVARELERARSESGGESILPLAYGGSNGKLTDGAVDERLFRRLGATRLLRTVCAVATGAAQQGLYGRMIGVALEDYVHAKLIVIWGANPPASGIHLVPIVKRAQEAGAKLVVIDPRRTKLARLADVHLAPRPGTDLPLALALVAWLFRTGRADRAFLAAHASGAEKLERRASEWSFERAADVCGLEAGAIERFAALYAEKSPAVIRCGWGLERNRNGGSAVASVLALPAVAGKFGLRGGGYTLSSGRAFEFADAVREPEPPTRALNMNQLGRALLLPLTPPVRVLFVYDANPVATLPEQNLVRRGLEREDLFTVVFDQVHTDTASYADVVLPATTFLEHFEMRGGYGSLALLAGEPVIEPIGEARPNYAVFAELVARLGLDRPGDPCTPAELTQALLDGKPRARAELERDGIAFPDCGRGPVQFVDVFPRTSDQRVHLVPDELDREAPRGLYGYQEDPGGPGRLALISPSTERTISSSLGELVLGEVALEIHPGDAAPRGIHSGDAVRIWNERGEVVTHARLSQDTRAGVVVLPKGLWLRHCRSGTTSNALAPDTSTDLGGGACFNDARVEVERFQASENS